MNQFIQKNEEQILDDLRGLIQIESTNGDAGEVTKEAPLGENINEAINYVLDLGEKFGFKTKNLDGYSGYVEMGPEDAEELIGILAHVDTVPVGDDWTYAPFDLTVEDGKLYGRGTSDDKGPIIASLYAMKKLIEEGVPLKRKVRLIIGGDEESGGWKGMRRYQETEMYPTYSFSPDAEYPVIFAEKGILQLKLKSKEGSDSLQLDGGSTINMVPDKAHATVNEKTYSTEGVAAHAKEPEKGENALLKLGEVLREDNIDHPFLDLLEIANTDDLNINLSDEPSGELTLNPAIGHVDENESYLISDIRFPVTENIDEIVQRIEEKTKPLGYEAEVLDVIEPLHVNVESELVQKLLQVYNSYTGENAKPLAIGGGTYARAFDNTVASGVLFPGEISTMHQADEYWNQESLYKNIDLIAESIAALAAEEQNI